MVSSDSMTNIVELKTEPLKGDSCLYGILIDALNFCRNDEVVSVVVSMTTKHHTYNNFAISPQGTFAETVGNIERLKQRIYNAWEE